MIVASSLRIGPPYRNPNRNKTVTTKNGRCRIGIHLVVAVFWLRRSYEKEFQ